MTFALTAILAFALFGAVAILYMRLSRSFAFQMLMLFAFGGYLVLVAVINEGLALLFGPSAWLFQFGFVAGATVAALIVLVSPSYRASMKVQLAKHLFRHRYDYRDEWLRFSDTLGRRGGSVEALGVRVAKAIADILAAPGALLLAPGEDGGLDAGERWRWAGLDAQPRAAGPELVKLLTGGRIVELDAARGESDPAIPEWMVADPSAWALVPLVHFDRLQGAVLVERPRVSRALDWEDFDLLRVAGRQLASYLAEARGQEALGDAQRFDEFNRRFAFIIHDIKNLVSQLSLVARNAERHADNPDFRVDMVATLNSSVGKMNDLLARLSQHNSGRAEEPRAVAAAALVEGLARARRGQHSVVSSVTGDPVALADPARLEQALDHLIQNAIDASPANEPVMLSVSEVAGEVRIEVRDNGVGMSRDFIRAQLFKPFTSTKPAGFGVGAFEARTLIAAMGGRVEVDSHKGKGTVFAITLPAANPERRAA